MIPCNFIEKGIEVDSNDICHMFVVEIFEIFADYK